MTFAPRIKYMPVAFQTSCPERNITYYNPNKEAGGGRALCPMLVLVKKSSIKALCKGRWEKQRKPSTFWKKEKYQRGEAWLLLPE